MFFRHNMIMSPSVASIDPRLEKSFRAEECWLLANHCVRTEGSWLALNMDLPSAFQYAIDVNEPSVRRSIVGYLLIRYLEKNNHRKLCRRVGQIEKRTRPSLQDSLQNSPGGKPADPVEVQAVIQELRNVESLNGFPE